MLLFAKVGSRRRNNRESGWDTRCDTLRWWQQSGGGRCAVRRECWETFATAATVRLFKLGKNSHPGVTWGKVRVTAPRFARQNFRLQVFFAIWTFRIRMVWFVCGWGETTQFPASRWSGHQGPCWLAQLRRTTCRSWKGRKGEHLYSGKKTLGLVGQ